MTLLDQQNRFAIEPTLNFYWPPTQENHIPLILCKNVLEKKSQQIHTLNDIIIRLSSQHLFFYFVFYKLKRNSNSLIDRHYFTIRFYLRFFFLRSEIQNSNQQKSKRLLFTKQIYNCIDYNIAVGNNSNR